MSRIDILSFFFFLLLRLLYPTLCSQPFFFARFSPSCSPTICSERGKLRTLELFISHWTAFAPGYGNYRPGVICYIKEMRLPVRLWHQSKWKQSSPSPGTRNTTELMAWSLNCRRVTRSTFFADGSDAPGSSVDAEVRGADVWWQICVR